MISRVGPGPASIPYPPDAPEVLVCTRWGIGDLVMSLPALRALRRHYCGRRIHWLIGCQSADLADWVRGGQEGDSWQTYQSLGLDSWAELSATPDIDQLLDRLPPTTRVIDAVHAPRQLGERLLYGPWPTSNNDTAVEWQLGRSGVGPRRAVTASCGVGWGIELAEEDYGPPPLTPADEADAARHLDRVPTDRRPRLAVAANGGSPLKVYPPSQLADLIDRCVRRFGVRVLLLAGPEPAAAIATTKLSREADSVSLLEAMPLPTTAALLRQTRGLVTNDSGLMHLAAACGVPLVALFGPTSPTLYLPRISDRRGEPPRAVEPDGPQRDCPLRRPTQMGPPPCVAEGRCRQGIRSCVDQIDADRVVAEVARHLNPADHAQPAITEAAS